MINIDATVRHGKPFVYISNDQMNAEWGLRVPEWISCERGWFQFPDSIHWTGSHWTGMYQYEAILRYAQCRPQKAQDDSFGRVAEGLLLQVGVKPKDDRVEIVLRLRNVSNEAFRRILCDGGCFRHQSQAFYDDNYERTYIQTEKGLVPLNETDRSKGIRCVYFLNTEDCNYPHIPGMGDHPASWGRSNTRPTSSLIAANDVSGRFAVGIGYEKVFLISQNSDSYHHCMHSSPYFGTLGPKEKRMRRGVILFGENVKELFRRFDELGFEYTHR